jgi:hypothetical protein
MHLELHSFLDKGSFLEEHFDLLVSALISSRDYKMSTNMGQMD